MVFHMISMPDDEIKVIIRGDMILLNRDMYDSPAQFIEEYMDIVEDDNHDA